MNLHAIAGPVVAVVNPFIPVTIKVSTGSTRNPDGSRTPTYASTTASAQVQALQFRDIAQLQGLNLQGTRRKIYLSGDFEGLVRSQNKGGDLIIFPNDGSQWANSVWLVAMVLETWPDWCSVAVTLQVDK